MMYTGAAYKTAERENRHLRPRKKQVAKIEKALHQLGKELMNTAF